MTEMIGNVGPKPTVRGKKAVCASQHPIVTDTMLQVMKDGGNAVDAGIAGCIVQATVQHDMTNHTGTVTFLYYEAKAGKMYQLNSMGTIVPGLAPFRPIPPGTGMYAAGPVTPFACIPGFMPGMKALHEKFGTKPWSYLCQPAIKWADEGNVVSSFEFLVLVETMPFFMYTKSGRDHFTPNGFLPQVGERFKKPELAKTLRRLAEEGPDYFITGDWAKHFVEHGNAIGWKVELKHMNAIPPRWQEPLRFMHNGYEVVQLAPPERQGVYCAMVLGILEHFDLKSIGHYSEASEAAYLLAHALRWAAWETGFLNDPEVCDVPLDVWLSKEHQKMAADVIGRSKPKIDLTEHINLTSGPNALVAAGLTPKKPEPPAGSCELSIVDPDGNWVQMMNTLQSGGIPGAVVDGVPMVGSHGVCHMQSPIGGWFTGGGRMRSVIGNTIVLRDGKPVLSLGTPGNVHCTMPQVLLNILDYGMEPPEAVSVPRMLPLTDDYSLGIESRVPESLVAGLARIGILVKPHPKYDYHMGSFQVSWRDEKTGLLNSCTDPRRAGHAGGF